jgi:hypothetical protein
VRLCLTLLVLRPELAFLNEGLSADAFLTIATHLLLFSNEAGKESRGKLRLLSTPFLLWSVCGMLFATLYSRIVQRSLCLTLDDPLPSTAE